MSMDGFRDEPPPGDLVTAYDLSQIDRYLRLLEAATDPSATWQEAVTILFGLDPAAEPTRARLVYDSHLARARWISSTGYRHMAAIAAEAPGLRIIEAKYCKGSEGGRRAE